MPLYLEWAPENSLSSPTLEGQEVQSTEEYEHKETTTTELENQNQRQLESEDEEPEEGTTLFVKNLNFETTDDALRKVIMLNFYPPCLMYFS